MNSQCNSSASKPICAAPADNTCVCTARNPDGDCTTGQCVWHVDPALTGCVCVPGQIQSCTLPTGNGIQACNSNGSNWGTCTAASAPG